MNRKTSKRDLFKELFQKYFPNIKVQSKDNFSEVNFFSELHDAGEISHLHKKFDNWEEVINWYSETYDQQTGKKKALQG